MLKTPLPLQGREKIPKINLFLKDMHILSNYCISTVRAANNLLQSIQKTVPKRRKILRSEKFPSIFMLLAYVSNKIFTEMITLYYLVDCVGFLGWLFFKEVFLGWLSGFCLFWCCYGFRGLFQGVRVVWFVCWPFLNSYCLSPQAFPMSHSLQWIVFPHVLILYASSPPKFKTGQN